MSEETGPAGMRSGDEPTAGTPIYDDLCLALDVEPGASTGVASADEIPEAGGA